jgi:transposase InsO family protein
MTEVMKVSRGGYYEWVKNGCKSRRQIEDEQYLELIRIEFDKSRQTYGPRRLAKELKKNGQGQRIGRRRIEEIMRENNIVPKTVKKFKATTNSNHDYPVSPNLLNRNFKVDRLNFRGGGGIRTRIFPEYSGL